MVRHCKLCCLAHNKRLINACCLLASVSFSEKYYSLLITHYSSYRKTSCRAGGAYYYFNPPEAVVMVGEVWDHWVKDMNETRLVMKKGRHSGASWFGEWMGKALRFTSRF